MALVSRHVSIPDGPVTTNRAVGTFAVGLTVSVAVRLAPRSPVIVTVVCEVTLLVETVKVPVVDPAAIVTLEGTVAAPVLLLDRLTTAPLDPAALSNVAVPCEVLPPLTAVGLRVNDVNVSAGVSILTTSVVDAVTPLYEALIVTVNAPPTARVATLKVALVAPAGTVTLGGTVTGSLADNDTDAPPDGAGLPNCTVPVTELPPTTDEALSEMTSVFTTAPTVNVADCDPFNVAVIVAVPAATAVTVKVAVVAPAATDTEAGTVATAVLLLESWTVEPPLGAAAESVTVPCPDPPALALFGLSATPAIDTVVVGGVGPGLLLLELPHRTVEKAARIAIAVTIMRRGVDWRSVFM